MSEPSGAARRPSPMAPDLPGLGTDPASVLRRIEVMEQMLEASIAVPGLGRRIGLDAVAGLIPVFGDLVTAALGAWLVWEARNLGMSRWQLWRMGANVAFDAAIGAVPVVGDAFDLLFRSNTRNLRIVRRHIARHHPELRTIQR